MPIGHHWSDTLSGGSTVVYSALGRLIIVSTGEHVSTRWLTGRPVYRHISTRNIVPSVVQLTRGINRRRQFKGEFRVMYFYHDQLYKTPASESPFTEQHLLIQLSPDRTDNRSPAHLRLLPNPMPPQIRPTYSLVLKDELLR